MEQGTFNVPSSLKTLKVYHSVKTLRKYYMNVIHCHLPKDMKHTVGLMILNNLFSCVTHLAKIAVTRNNAMKMEAITEFLVLYELITDEIEALVDAHAISFKQASYMFGLIMDIERQMGGFRKSIESQSPQPTE